MKEKSRISIPLKYEGQVKSLCWVGDVLIDYVSGNVIIDLDGSISDPRVIFGYKFDSAIVTPDGEYSVIYELHGTKGVLLNRGKEVRELNRSYYCADAYEFPICFVSISDGDYGIAYCPDKYNIVEIERADDGERLTKQNRDEIDFFQSRLQVSPGQIWLLSAGWVWHPLDSVILYELSNGFADPKPLTSWNGGLGDFGIWEINNAAFIDDFKLLISGTGDDVNEDASDEKAVVVYDLREKRVVSRKSISEPTGHLMALSEDFAVTFYKTPKLLDLNTGETTFEWKDIPTDERNSSIWSIETFSAFAADVKNKRFAVATPNTIEVVTLS
ncbi:MAG: hypothetical protein ABI791_13150 [Acidobacteriota bacterium]